MSATIDKLKDVDHPEDIKGMRAKIKEQDDSYYKLKSRRDELKVRLERRQKEILMLGMSCQEAKDAKDLA
jgi:hypothetical protein